MSMLIRINTRQLVAASVLAAFAIFGAWIYGAEFARQKLVIFEPGERDINDIYYQLALLRYVQTGDTEKAETLLVENLDYALDQALSSSENLTIESCRKLQKVDDVISSKYLLQGYTERIEEMCSTVVGDTRTPADR
jgi:hypothetical protein